ncbi:MAG TPA: hypothetical protein VFT56_06050 [Sphingomonas sp.]|nr:hypothetical protein [Sphingomonas sp.]
MDAPIHPPPIQTRLAALYGRLLIVMPSPVIDLNRAVAHGMVFGPEVGLRLVNQIAGAAALRNNAPLPAARGDFLFRPRGRLLPITRA